MVGAVVLLAQTHRNTVAAGIDGHALYDTCLRVDEHQLVSPDEVVAGLRKILYLVPSPAGVVTDGVAPELSTIGETVSIEDVLIVEFEVTVEAVPLCAVAEDNVCRVVDVNRKDITCPYVVAHEVIQCGEESGVTFYITVGIVGVQQTHAGDLEDTSLIVLLPAEALLDT